MLVEFSLIHGQGETKIKANDRPNKAAFIKASNEYIRKIMVSEGIAGFGSFASFDLKDAKATVSYSFVAAKKDQADTSLSPIKSILSFTGSGGFTEGSGIILSGGKANGNLSLDTKYIFWIKSAPFTIPEEEISLRSKRKEIEDWATLEKKKYVLGKTELFQESEFLKRKIKSMLAEMAAVKAGFTAEKDSVKKNELDQKLYKLKLENSQANSRLLEVQTKLTDTYSPTTYEFDSTIDVRAKNKLFQLLGGVTELHLTWLSFRYKALTRSFFLYDTTTRPGTQLPKKDNTEHEFGVEYNRLNISRWKNDFLYFLTTGVSVSITDNFSTLVKKDVTDRRTFSTGSAQRSSSTNFSAFDGNYESGIVQWRVYADFYRLLPTGSLVSAIHLYPDFLIRDKDTNVLNAGLGVLFPLNKKGEPTISVLNIEFYLFAKDVTSNGNYKTTSTLLSRSEIGFRLGLPISTFKL